MPANFPEAWLNRGIQSLNNADQATFLEGIPEINAEIHVINPSTATEKNKIYVPTTEFEVDVLINNNSYPIPFQQYEDDTVEITLDKYQTKVVELPAPQKSPKTRLKILGLGVKKLRVRQLSMSLFFC